MQSIVFLFKIRQVPIDIAFRKWMAGPFLYSTNPWLKFHIAATFYAHNHYVWCADCFDGRGSFLHSGGRYPPSSNPAEIFTNLRAATLERPDRHNRDIEAWQLSLKMRAGDDAVSGKISSNEEKEIVYLIDAASLPDWRPLLYIVHRDAVAGRMKQVPINKRASHVMEYVIEDLHPNEFDVIEVR
jgi:hypothetical protein